MKIVIDIPESKYLSLIKCFENDIPLGKVDTAIINGTPLPKECGRLIDADKLKLELYETDDGCDTVDIYTGEVRAIIDKMPTILEPYKEGEENAKS